MTDRQERVLRVDCFRQLSGERNLDVALAALGVDPVQLLSQDVVMPFSYLSALPERLNLPRSAHPSESNSSLFGCQGSFAVDRQHCHGAEHLYPARPDEVQERLERFVDQLAGDGVADTSVAHVADHAPLVEQQVQLHLVVELHAELDRGSWPVATLHPQPAYPAGVHDVVDHRDNFRRYACCGEHALHGLLVGVKPTKM